MKRTHNSEWYTDEQGEMIYGINLGADYTAEHEEGTDSLLELFGVASEDYIYGIEKRQIRRIPPALSYGQVEVPDPNLARGKRKKKIQATYLIITGRSTHGPVQYSNYKDLPLGLRFFGPGSLGCAWDQESFGILASGKDAKWVEVLYNHFLQLDIAIGMGAHLNPFGRSGLVFTIISKLPAEVIQRTYEQDKDHHQLLQEVKLTGIESILKENGKKFFALVPKWKDKETKEITFFLNPMEQHLYNHGWFSIPELIAWSNNEGPIMKHK